jgi:hypothetical protein
MEWYQILMVIGIPSIISGLVARAINRGMKARDAKQEEIRAQSEAIERQNKALMAGVQAILRDRLLTGYKHYMSKGWADYDDRQNMENLYEQYHALGVNGVMDGYRAKFLALPEYDPKSVALGGAVN